MAKKLNANEEQKKQVTVDAGEAAGAKRIVDVVDVWVGRSPDSFQKGLISKDLPELSCDDILDREVTIFGYQERSGKIKGKDTEYLITLVTVEGETKLYSLIVGGMVLVRKIREVGHSEALPAIGRVVKPEGKAYFDFVA